MFDKVTRSLLLSIAACFFAILIPDVVHAHVNAGETVGFWHGFQHPIGGLDHILAMVAVGLWATQLGGSATWAVPATFVSVMAIGGILGMVNVPFPLVEQGIIASDLILGGLILFATRLPLAVSIGIVGLLATFHGYAHGAEMPKDASALNYAAGFMLATLILHLSGMGAATLVKKLSEDRLIRIAGGGIILAGVYVLVNSWAG